MLVGYHHLGSSSRRPRVGFCRSGQTGQRPEATGAESSAYAKAKVGQATQTFTFQAQAISDISVPLVDIETRNLDPGVVMSPMGDAGDVSVNVDMSVLGKAFSSNFMGVKSKANKIMFIIDYSASMKGRDKVMRSELSKAIDKLPAVGSVAVIFFSDRLGWPERMPMRSIRNGRGTTVKSDGNQWMDTNPSVPNGFPLRHPTRRSSSRPFMTLLLLSERYGTTPSNGPFT